MKTKEAASTKKQTVTVKDLKTRKNPRGGHQHVAQQYQASQHRSGRP